MKRFWDKATAEPRGEGWVILLDGKPLQMPGQPVRGGAELRVPRAGLAYAIAAEWQAAGGGRDGELTFDHVPLTRLAGTAQDRIEPDPAPVATALAQYAETDVLCYRAEHPVPLVVRQAREWQPWLDWLWSTHGARLRSTAGVAHLAQDEAALQRMRTVLAGQSAAVLAGLGIAVPALGSVVLGLALAHGALDASQAYALAHLDELYQVEQWGEDSWAARRRADVLADIALAARFIALARQA